MLFCNCSRTFLHALYLVAVVCIGNYYILLRNCDRVESNCYKIVQISDRGNFLMAVHGAIGPFDREKEDWTSCSERLDQYFTANFNPFSWAVTDTRASSTLLKERPRKGGDCHHCGRKGHIAKACRS